MERRIVSLRILALAALAAASACPVAQANELLNVIVDGATGTGGKSIAGFAYDPTQNTFYVSAFGASGDPGNPVIRKVTRGESGVLSTPWLSEGQLQLYYRDGNPDRGVSTPLQQGFLLNPKPIGNISAYSFALISDIERTNLPGSTTLDPAASKRFYAYNLQTPPAGGDGRDVFATRVTIADMQSAVGTTNTSTNQGRQFAWSGDGQSVYFQDSSSAFGGVWKLPAAGGAPVRLLADSTNSVSELAVVSAGGVDRIFLRGSSGSGNDGGIDVISHDGTTTTLAAAVTKAVLNDFLELPSNAAGVAATSLSADAEGNVYFTNSNSNPERRGLFRLDPQGRLVKVVSRAERVAAFGGNPNSNMLRQQVRSATFAGPDGAFPVTQILYVENHIDAVAAVNVFKPGDFNRDNALDADDIGLFKPVLTLRRVAQTVAANLKFDGNGNGVVDWKDVKVFQPFFDLGDGDVDLNGLVDFADFLLLRDNFGQAAKRFTEGDLDGDDDVDVADFRILEGSFGYASDVLGLGLTPAPFDPVAWEAFQASIPEPGSLALAALAATAAFGRRRARR